MKGKLSFLAGIILLVFSIQSCKKQDVSLAPGAGSAGLVDSPHVTINAHVKQGLTSVPNAKLKLVYNWNGAAQVDSAYTDTSGAADFILPLNTIANLSITSHCGVLLYERKFGPFVSTGTVDTTFRVLAYSPTCDSVPPSQYFTYRLNGVEHRFTYPADSFRISGYAALGVTMFIMKRDGSDRANVDVQGNSPNLGWFTGVSNSILSTSPGNIVYTERGTIGGYSAGRFNLDLSHLTPPEMEPDTEYQIPCTWRFKIEEVPEWPEW